MRGFTTFVLLLVASVAITTGHVINIFLNPIVTDLLVATGSENGGKLNPAILDPTGVFDVTIIVRITVIYTDEDAVDPTQEQSSTFDVVVEPEDWNDDGPPCSYLEDFCIVFQNHDIVMYGPAKPGGTAVIGVENLDALTDRPTANIVSTTFDVRCQVPNMCDPFATASADLDPLGSGIPFGVSPLSFFGTNFCLPSVVDDPHVTGLRGQHYDWSGEDGGWYAFLSTQGQLQMNLRVTSHLPTTFPERQLVTGVAVVTEGGHTITADIVNPLNLAPTCQQTAVAMSIGSNSAPCLVNGGLRVTVDGREEVPGAGEYHFDGGIHITAINLPLECQRFGDYPMWEDLGEEQKLKHAARNLRSVGSVTSIFEWLLADSVMIAPPWCVKYLEELDRDMTALAGVQSNHAVLRIESPNLSLRVNVGINSEEAQTLQDGRVVPAASFWQMDVRVEEAEGVATAKGMLGETARLVRDEQTGKAVMSGLGVLRGNVEDYRVMHPLGTEFKQLFVPEEGA